jgi:hypothetical protein
MASPWPFSGHHHDVLRSGSPPDFTLCTELRPLKDRIAGSQRQLRLRFRLSPVT